MVTMILCSNVNHCYAGNLFSYFMKQEQNEKIDISEIMKPVSTDRLIIEFTTEEDCMSLAKYFKDKSVRIAFGNGVQRTENEALEDLKLMLVSNQMRVFTIKNLQNEPLGQVWVKLKNDVENCICIDVWLGMPFWGQSIASEAVCALMDQIDDPNIDVSITVSATNEKAKRAIFKTGERLGAFIKSSKGEYIPQEPEKSKIYIKEINFYREEYTFIEENILQYNLKIFKNEELIFDDVVDEFPLILPGIQTSIEYICSKNQF